MSEPSPKTGRSPVAGACAEHGVRFRVRYSETDQMGTFYNSRPLEWFEHGRTEMLRHFGLPYAAMEERGLFLPLVEARVEYLGRARYDDELEMASTLRMEGRARLRWSVTLVHAGTDRPVVRGYTIHAFTDATGKPVRPPPWFLAFLENAGRSTRRDRRPASGD
jgi:acyl-CoA thioester hydrolase